MLGPLSRLLACAAACGALASPPAEAEGLRLEGEMRMGLVRDTGTGRDRTSAEAAPRWRLDRGYRMRMRAEGVTDGGLTFGAVLEIDSDDRDRRRR
jgi:hypothetical protein